MTKIRKITLLIYAVAISGICLMVYVSFNSSYKEQAHCGGSILSDDSISNNYKPAQNKTGESLFEGNCTACHAMDKIVVGPALRGVNERRKHGWLVAWIKDPAAMISSGDPLANKLYKEFNQQNMTAFGSLSDPQIDSILAYIGEY